MDQIVAVGDGAAHQHRQRYDGVPRGGHAAFVHIGDVHQLLHGAVPLKGEAAALYPLIGALQPAQLGEGPYRQQQAQQHHAQRVEHIGNGADIVAEAEAVRRDQPHAERRPAGKRHGNAQAARDDIGLQRQMLTGDTVFIGDLPHGEGHRQGAEILVQKHDGRHEPRQHQRPLGAGGDLQQQIPEAHKGAGLLKQCDHAAEADDDAQRKLVRGVGQCGVHGVDGTGEKMLPVQQHHSQQRGQYHGIRHLAGLQRVKDQKHKRCKGHYDLQHGAFSLLRMISVV